MGRSSRQIPRCWSSRLIAMSLVGALAWPAWGQPELIPVNQFCPLMPSETIDPGQTTLYQGQRVAFCCATCLNQFERNPARHAAKLTSLQYETSPSPAKSGDPDRPAATTHDHESHSHGGASPTRQVKHQHKSQATFAARLVAWLGKFHPVTVHFPIAMLLGAAMAELSLIRTRKPFFAIAGRFCLWVGALGAVLAAVLGWFFGGFHFVDGSWLLTSHRWVGTTAAAWSVLVLFFGERAVQTQAGSRKGYRVVLFLGAGLVGAAGFLGGSLIYGLAHYAW